MFVVSVVHNSQKATCENPNTHPELKHCHSDSNTAVSQNRAWKKERKAMILPETAGHVKH